MTRQFAKMIAYTLSTLSVCCFTTSYAASFEPLQNIELTAQQFVLAMAKDDVKRPDAIEVKISNLDPRLRLPACNQALEAFFPDGAARIGNTSVGIRCKGIKPWTLYVSVRVSIFYDVLVATRPLPRGKLLAADDFRLAKKDISTLRGEYLADAAQLTGKILTRPLALGMPVTQNQLTMPNLVQRGDAVSIRAQAGGLEVRMRGKALKAGAAGDKIQVRTSNSNRVVEGTIINTGVVQVTL